MNFKRSPSATLLALAGAIALSASFAHATPINPITAGTYSATGVTIGNPSEGHTLTGTVTFNSSGFISAANLTFNDAALGDPVFSVIGSEGVCCSPVDDFAFIGVSGNKGQLDLLYSPNLNASGDIVLCVTGSGCNQASYLQYYWPNFGPVNFTGGALDPVASANSVSTIATPEPPSLVLMGSGLIGIAGISAAMHGRFLKHDE